MYAVCLFCQRSLGRNEAIEHFPVGRRLAYDPERGRLWVVCPSCERWCLAPFEERWEALEEMERRFRMTRLRVSTDNIGLARLREGVELVRVGRPLRPELAIWRYGDQFGRRRRRVVFGTAGASAVAGAALVVGGAALAAFSGVAFSSAWALVRAAAVGDPGDLVATVASPNGPHYILRGELDEVRFQSGAEGDDFGLVYRHHHGVGRLTGAQAALLLAQLLPHVNRAGAARRRVLNAVTELERAGDARAYVNHVVSRSLHSPTAIGETRYRSLGPTDLSRTQRLALEMATHEHLERQALQGELAALEFAWREAERVASIADRLVTPPSVDAKLATLQSETRSAPPRPPQN